MIHDWRRQRLARKMQQRSLDAMIITSPTSIFYLTGLTPSAPPGMVISSEPKAIPVLVVREIEVEDVRKVSPFPVEGAPLGTNGAAQLAAAVRSLVGASARVAFDDDVMVASKLRLLQETIGSATLVAASDLIMELRMIKDDEEISVMREAATVSDRAMLAAVEAIRAGKTECDAAIAAEATWRSHGLGPAYEVLIGSGKRSAALRRFPSLVVPAEGELVRFDFAARVSPAAGFGYNNDLTRTFTRGKPSPENLSLLTAGLAVFEGILSEIMPGRTIGEVANRGLRAVNGTKYMQWTKIMGHGIGADVAEPPAFIAGSEFVMQPGNCFAIEPMITVPGEKGVCFENVVVVTEQGSESLNQLELRLWGG